MRSRSTGLVLSFFFFQAEDGIRDLTVTGVQTCALPISGRRLGRAVERDRAEPHASRRGRVPSGQVRRNPLHQGLERLRSPQDRKSTRLNSSHSQISYAVFCLKKKKKTSKKQRWLSSKRH